MADSTNKSSDDAKVFDVAKPEESKLNTGSKPMVIGHKSMAGDPSVRDSKEAAETEAQKEPEVAGKKIVIQPTSEQQAAKAEEEKSAESKKPEETTVTETQPVAEESKPEPVKEAEKPAEESKTPKEDTEAKSENPLVVASEEEKASERDQALEELIKSKKYEVDIKQKSTTSVGTMLKALLLILFLGIGAIAALLYTGIVETDFDLPFVSKAEPTAEIVEEQLDSQATVPVKTLKVQDSVYSMTVPDTWETERKLTPVIGEDNELFTDTYTLPSGTMFTIDQDPGGRGGDCQPAADDAPHTEGNICPTLEYLEKTPLNLGDRATELLAPNHSAFITSKFFTDTDGTQTYNLCPLSFNADNEPELSTPLMGAVTPSCVLGISVADGPSLVATIDGPDNTTEAFFENEDVIAIKTALQTLVLR